MRTKDFRVILSSDAYVVVRLSTDKKEIVSYAVVLVVEHRGEFRTVRCFDNAHGQHDMHRYNPAGIKEPAENFHHGTAREAFHCAVVEVRRNWMEMIAGWRARP
jgi:hypothetical protein